MKRTALALTLILAISVLLIAGTLTVEVANANFFPGDTLYFSSPNSNKVYATTSIPLKITALREDPTPEIVSITYRLDENPNVTDTLTDLDKSLGSGLLDHSEFWAETVLNNLPEGNHTLKAYSTDAIGEHMYASVDFVIDISYTSPLSVLSPQNITYYATEVPLNFICREGGKYDGVFSYGVYMLDGIGSDYIYGNSTLTDLSVGSHIIQVTVCNENGFSSETVQFSISQTPDSAVSPSSSPHPLSIDPNFSLYTGIGLSIIAIATFALLIYFKKRSHQAENGFTKKS
jgi:hypothetical protein